MQFTKIALGLVVVAVASSSSAFAAPAAPEAAALARRQSGEDCPPGLLWDPVNNECRNVSTFFLLPIIFLPPLSPPVPLRHS
jgi:hypothetical protein